MAKIGIITFAQTLDNYGQVLQYLATQGYLDKRGHTAVLVEPGGWEPSKFDGLKVIYHKFTNIVLHLLHPTTYKVVDDDTEKENEVQTIDDEKNKMFTEWGKISEVQERVHPRQFESFRTKFFNRQAGSYNKIIKAKYNAFCVGSDQTWSCAGYHMMLGWVPDKTKKFSLAPSVGHKKYTDKDIDGFKQLLQRFNFITVRESSGKDLCERCGIHDAVQVLDPTFLLKSEDYNKYALNPHFVKPYVFIYMLGGCISKQMHEIISFCESKGLDIKYVESQGRKEQVEKIYATIPEWLGLLNKASYVITNSFHGMAFSIIYRKPMLVFPLTGIMESMNTRIYDLATLMKLEKRIYKDDMNILFEPVDWSKSDNIIEGNRNRMDYLLQTIRL